jgi:hypothetical protein
MQFRLFISSPSLFQQIAPHFLVVSTGSGGEQSSLFRASYHSPQTLRNFTAHLSSILNEFLNVPWQYCQESQVSWTRHRIQKLTAINNSPASFHNENTEQCFLIPSASISPFASSTSSARDLLPRECAVVDAGFLRLRPLG